MSCCSGTWTLMKSPEMQARWQILRCVRSNQSSMTVRKKWCVSVDLTRGVRHILVHDPHPVKSSSSWAEAEKSRKILFFFRRCVLSALCISVAIPLLAVTCQFCHWRDTTTTENLKMFFSIYVKVGRCRDNAALHPLCLLQSSEGSQ